MNNPYQFTYFRGDRRIQHRISHRIPQRWAVRLCTWLLIPILRLTKAHCFMLEQGEYTTSYIPKGHYRPAVNLHMNPDALHPDDEGANLISLPHYWQGNGNWISKYPRITKEGMLIEEARTNLLPNSY